MSVGSAHANIRYLHDDVIANWISEFYEMILFSLVDLVFLFGFGLIRTTDRIKSIASFSFGCWKFPKSSSVLICLRWNWIESCVFAEWMTIINVLWLHFYLIGLIQFSIQIWMFFFLFFFFYFRCKWNNERRSNAVKNGAFKHTHQHTHTQFDVWCSHDGAFACMSRAFYLSVRFLQQLLRRFGSRNVVVVVPVAMYVCVIH